jgi:hypothetical protein
VKVGHDGDPALQRPTALNDPTLIRIVMGQETVPSGIRIITESYMTSDDIRERFDMVSDARQLQP